MGNCHFTGKGSKHFRPEHVGNHVHEVEEIDTVPHDDDISTYTHNIVAYLFAKRVHKNELYVDYCM